jgi:hypothetical protein
MHKIFSKGICRTQLPPENEVTRHVGYSEVRLPSQIYIVRNEPSVKGTGNTRHDRCNSLGKYRESFSVNSWRRPPSSPKSGAAAPVWYVTLLGRRIAQQCQRGGRGEHQSPSTGYVRDILRARRGPRAPRGFARWHYSLDLGFAWCEKFLVDSKETRRRLGRQDTCNDVVEFGGTSFLFFSFFFFWAGKL